MNELRICAVRSKHRLDERYVLTCDLMTSLDIGYKLQDNTPDSLGTTGMLLRMGVFLFADRQAEAEITGVAQLQYLKH